MTNTVQPATDEQIAYYEEFDFNTISRQVALELLARIRADAVELAAWRARDRESEAFLVYRQQRAKANEERLLEYEGYKLNFNEAIEQRDAAEARAARMAEALRFYADEGNYENDTVDIGVGDMPIPLSNQVDNEGGRLARAALSAPDTQAGALLTLDQWELGRELIEWAAGEHNCICLDGHYFVCEFCHENGTRVHDTSIRHKPDCLHLRAKVAKAVVEAALKEEPTK